MGNRWANKTAQERFWEKVHKTDGCWLWTGAISCGYASFGIGTHKSARGHRWIYEQVNGTFDSSLSVCHKCDVKHCVRPDHLFLGNQRENIMDCARKGRMNSKLNPDKVREIRSLTSSGMSQYRIARQLGVDRITVRSVIRGETWSHVI